ncbi:related to serine protease [Phialocephala subalpina]|uniref:Related to serine protease n=1 Tax=Phialocephala subalpina TaxID=576137 RepID=A0A1L7X5P6_9HELO|nr:related to serine protease [Phialocephala subalpina]
MKAVSFAVACLASVVSCKFAPSHPRNPSVPASADSTSSVQAATFDQLIDHSNPSLGTFKQRYWYSTQYWNGTGSPVIVFNPGEEAADDFTGYLGTATLTGQYAEAVGGAGIVIEHRYWGNSSPFTDLTSANLTYHTVKQAVADMNYFAKNAKLPFDTTGGSNADKAPWVLVGGSYSGALSAWTATSAPGTFWAYHASSAPVEAIEDYWGYFYPIGQGMPKNCSKDISTVIEYVDGVLTTGSSSDKLALKQKFGLGTVEHDSDFARTLVGPLDLWQSSIADFLPFCDYLEGVTAGAKLPGPDGVGLTVALENYASYINSSSGCSATDCYDSYNKDNSEYTTTILDPKGGAGRQWQWMLCNEAFGWWQTGAPANQTTLVSRFVTADYWQQECNFFFPGVQFGLTEEKHNDDYEGWGVKNTQRLMFSNGEFDPWRSAGVSSAFRPGGPLASTPEIPVFIVPDGIHVQDLYMNNVTPAILDLRKQELAQMVSWIEEYYTKGSNTTTKNHSATSTSSKPTSTTSSTSKTTTPAPITTSTKSWTTTTAPRSTTVTSWVSETTTVDCETETYNSVYARQNPTKVARAYQA